MSIVTLEILESTTQIDGTQRVQVAFTDHLSNVYNRSYDFSQGVNVNNEIAIRQISIEQLLIDDEIKNYIGVVENGDIAPLDVSPQHPETDSMIVRKRRFSRRLLRYAMTHKDLKIVRKIMYPIWYYLKFESGFTAQQIADYLNISLAKLSTINSRFQAIHDNLAFIDADDEMIGEVD